MFLPNFTGLSHADASRHTSAPTRRTALHWPHADYRDASLFFPGCAGIFACGIRDVTNQGAGIRLTGLNLLPVHFDLSFDNFRTSRRCHLVWRDGDFVGVEFLT